uniref:CSON010662 protein n=1 Tax=Culicoides sonorensis TaxID=179676 RepID=A0A336KHP4_CULSO
MTCISKVNIPFRLITFDVVDTLIQFRTAPGKKYGELGAMFGVLADNNKLVANFKTNWNHMNRAHPNFGLNTKIGYKEWWRRVVIGTFRESSLSDIHIPTDKLNKLCDHLLEEYKTSSCWGLCYGTIDFLNYLKLQRQIDGEPFKLGVVSNFDPRLDILLRNMKISHYFDFVINSYDAGIEKPNIDIFKKAMKASEIEGLKPKECLHIGHSVLPDYFGAQKAGMYALLVHEKSPETLRAQYGPNIEDYHVFNSLFDLHKKLANGYIKWDRTP